MINETFIQTQGLFYIVQIIFPKNIPLLINNSAFCSLRIKDETSKSNYHKGINSTDRDKLLNINFKCIVVCKKCCWIGKIILPEKIIHNLNADYHVKSHHATL